MGIVNDLWWLSGVVLAAPIGVVGLEYLGRGDTLGAAAFLLVAAAALLLPEYVRWRIFGGGSVLQRIPGVGRDGEE